MVTVTNERLCNNAECMQLFQNLGGSGHDMIANTTYLDGRSTATCQQHADWGAWTEMNSCTVYLCNAFTSLSASGAATIMIHEALHDMGLHENPPRLHRNDIAADQRSRSSLMRPFMVSTLAIALTVLLSSTSVLHGEGCGLNAFDGRSGDTLHFWVIQGGEPPTRFSWHVGDDIAHAWTIPPYAVPGRNEGSKAWQVVRSGLDTAANRSSVNVFEVDSLGDEKPAGRLEMPQQPLSFDSTEDRSGSPWLMFELMKPSDREVSIWNRRDTEWIHVATVPGELLHPRFIGDDLWIGRFRVSSSGDVSELHAPAGAEYAWFGTVDETIGISASKTGWITTDRGATWTPLPLPTTGPGLSLLPTDGPMPAISWSDGSMLRIARWGGSKWQELAALNKREHDISGPVVVLGNRVVLLGLCYRTSHDEPGASTDATIVIDGKASWRRLRIEREKPAK